MTAPPFQAVMYREQPIKRNYGSQESKKKILIIDDEAIVRESVKHMIANEEEFSSLETIEASDGDRVVDLIDEHGITYVISDYRLGGNKLNGIEILEKIKTHKKDVRVLLMSNHRTSDESYRALTKGALNFIVKPICRGDIRGLVEKSK
jgi:DNA-binding NtrC family response regulator